MTQRIYAHAVLDRLLVSEVVIDRIGQGMGDVVVNRRDRSGHESHDDFEWTDGKLNIAHVL